MDSLIETQALLNYKYWENTQDEPGITHARLLLKLVLTYTGGSQENIALSNQPMEEDVELFILTQVSSFKGELQQKVAEAQRALNAYSINRSICRVEVRLAHRLG